VTASGPLGDAAEGEVPELGLLDNTVNIAYVFGKVLRRTGVRAALIEGAAAPFNQRPMWEDLDLAAPTAEVVARSPSDEYWRRQERRLGWIAPLWIVRPRRRPFADTALLARLLPRLAHAMPAALVPFGVAIAAQSAPVIRATAAQRFVLVQGPSAGLAYLAGRPYAVMTTGWDIRTLPFMTGARNPVHRARAHLQRAALAHARRVLATLPAHDLQYIERLGLGGNTTIFPVPVDVDGYAAVPAGTFAAVYGEELAARARGKLVILSPSRVEFEIKGTDLLLRAFARALERDPAQLLIVLAWGRDVERAIELARSLGIAEQVAFVREVMSKVRLVRAFRHADVVADQFVLTAYGSLARDALACGRPVISAYEPRDPQPHPSHDPAPIVSARTVDEIVSGLAALGDAGARERIGAAGLAWIRRTHLDAPLRQLAAIRESRGPAASGSLA